MLAEQKCHGRRSGLEVEQWQRAGVDDVQSMKRESWLREASQQMPDYRDSVAEIEMPQGSIYIMVAQKSPAFFKVGGATAAAWISWNGGSGFRRARPTKLPGT